MRKIVFHAHADCVGTDHYELVCFEPVNGEEVNNAFLDSYAQDIGYEWAGQWEPSCGEEDDDYESADQYYEACGWHWEEYNPAEHNGHIDQDAEGFEEE